MGKSFYKGKEPSPADYSDWDDYEKAYEEYLSAAEDAADDYVEQKLMERSI